jgi:hypothetical protein
LIIVELKREEEFKYSGTTLTDEKCVQEKLRADLSKEMRAATRCRTFYLPICYPKI